MLSCHAAACRIRSPTKTSTAPGAVREFVNKSAASTASPDYVNFQAVFESAPLAASSWGGHASGRLGAVREFANKSAASAASGDYVKFQAVIKSAASAASLRGGRASGRLDHGLLFAIFGRASGPKIAKNSQNLGPYGLKNPF